MAQKDVGTIFRNITELAVFSDMLIKRLERALGSVLEGGVEDDTVGEMLLDMVCQNKFCRHSIYGANFDGCRCLLWNLNIGHTLHDIQ